MTSPTTQPASGLATASARHQQLKKYAGEWVSQTFFGTLLKQMRESPFRSELLDGGKGGRAFGPLLDQHLAQRMSKAAAGEKLVNAIVRKLEANRAYAPLRK